MIFEKCGRFVVDIKGSDGEIWARLDTQKIRNT